MKKLFIAALGLTLLGCAALAPGADPLVVRAEQLESGANATFETFLTIDWQNHVFLATNAPAAHNFAQYLREPVMVNGTNYPRDIVFILSLNAVKQSYKAGKTGSNDMVLAITTLQSALNQAGLYISTTSTNH